MKCLRCTICLINWPPDTATYTPCPICHGMVRPGTDEPISHADAQSLKNHADFERWLDENDRRGPADPLEQLLAA